MSEEPSIEKVVGTFIKIREARRKATVEHEAKDRKLAGQMETLETYLLGRLRDMGARSVATEYGIVYQTLEVKPQAFNWELFYKWVAKNNAFEALEKRLTKKFIVTYMEDNDGDLPPGVKVHRQHAVTIRQSNKE